ncbi:aminotransferase class III-fold pyridoxal phosphate-dependent enzyme [[Brevibacterium] frigoritolerans]|nr:aminotransferase class III-fold pyridoxal phosphate-dependent enzyme [Peribacillus frigoritolerans]
MSWSDKDSEYMLQAYSKLPLTIVKGEGCYLYDEDGNEYLDMFAGVGVNQLGHSHPALIKTIKEQAEKLIHTSFHFYNPVAIEYAEKLSKLSNGGKVFFTTSGAEATEAALKMLYKWKQRTGDVRNGIVVFQNSFHGRTLGTISLTRQPSVYQDYPSQFYEPMEIRINNIDDFKEVIYTKKPLAFLMEPVLGSGGVFPISDSFMEQAQQICKETNTILIIDEIQSGMGRTGVLFAHQTANNINPDAILFGKGAGGGVPLGGVIAGTKLSQIYQKGDNGTTFSQQPLGAAMGITVLNVLTRGKFLNSTHRSRYLFEKLKEIQNVYPHIISEIRYKGLMFGITTTLTPELLKKFQHSLMKNGVLIDVTQGNIIRLLPPLIINHSHIDHFILKLDQTLNEFKSEQKLSFLASGGNKQ